MQSNMSKKNVAVVGAGLVGSLWAVYLAKRGYNVSVFDRRSDIRNVKVVQGKSINLALSDRGWKGLEGAGIRKEIEEVAIPMSGRLMHAVNGELTYQPYGKEGQAIYSVSRGILNQTLVRCAAEFENVSLNFEHKCVDVELDSNTIVFEGKNGEHIRQQFDQIFGTDGAFSAVRARMTKLDRNEYSQTYLHHGYKELEIPANEDGSHKMRNDCLHIWPRGEFMMIALPNIDGSFTCTLFFPFEGEVSFEKLKTDQDVLDFFEKYFPDAKAMMPELLLDFNTNPTASLVMTKCNPWNYKNQVALMGDAAHAIVPFYGQGMNCGFEDCTELNRLMTEMGEDHPDLLKEYSKLRKPNGDAILELALRNYIEMRDLTADKDFLLQKKIEGRFASKYPEKWIPLYSQVTFSHIPYHEALSSGIRQNEIMKEVMNRPDIEAVWDSEEIENEILKRI
jgi:kynurenine 3-monooxygenase